MRLSMPLGEAYGRDMVSHVGLDVCYKGFSIRYRDAIYLFGPVHKQYK